MEPSPSTSTPPKADGNATTNAHSYYGYLFDEKKRPTQVMDALLRGIAKYIIENIGDHEDRSLSPPKLAAFYKAVGGNYDPLFVDVPYPSISYIYQSIGCQHSLKPTKNDFAPPSIPALTQRGFVRWESIELLLNPEEHVPYLQVAVREFEIKHPDTGEPFPIDLPSESLPKNADTDIVKWHNDCAEKLRQQATPDELDDPSTRPTLPPRPHPRSGYSHLRNQSTPGRSPRERQEGADYFNSRPLAESGVSLRHQTSRDSSYRTHLSPHDESHRSSRARRRSVPDNYYSPSPTTTPLASSAHARPATYHEVTTDHTRSHSHPHHRRPSTSSSSDTEVTSPTSPHTSHRTSGAAENGAGTTPTIRYSIPTPTANPTLPFSYPPAHVHIHAPAQTLHHRHRGLSTPYSRERLAAYKIPIDLSGKLSAPFLRSAGVRHVQAPGGSGASSSANSRSNSRTRPPISGVRWGLNEVSQIRRRNSAATVDSDDSEDTATNERETERRRRVDGQVRPKLLQRRSGSHDGRYRVKEPDRRERERDRDDRELDRRRDGRRPTSPDEREERRHVDRPDGWR